MQHTCDHIGGLFLLPSDIQGVETIPLRMLGCCCILWIRPRWSITSSFTSFMWVLLNHVPSLTSIEEGISTMYILSTPSTTTLSTVLSVTLHLTSIAVLRLGYASTRCSTPLKVGVPLTLLPLYKSGLFTDAKVILFAPLLGPA